MGRKLGKDINSKPGGMKVIMEGRKANRGREKGQQQKKKNERTA